VKLPHPRYPNVPEIEFATMQWAQATGIQVPETKLIDLDEVDGLPLESFSHVEKVAYAIRRFDRQQSGLRVHMEDFAQILGLYPERKYEKCNYETLAKLVWVMAGDDGLKEMILRFVFMLASGNGDAHLKNWSLLYPDGLLAKLSPAYDLVSTIQYHDDNLALNFGKSKRWVDMRLDTFQRLAIKIECNESRLMEWTQEAVAATRDAWHTSGNDFGYDASARARIGRHMARVPLFSQV
jgi:serine/threonine-protein kinase HipA